MKTNKFRFSVLLFTLLVTVSFITGCTLPVQNGSETTTTSSQTADTTAKVAEPDKLTVFLRERWAGVGFDNFVINTIQEKTNTKWDILVGPQAKFMDQLNIYFASGTIPDIMNLSASDSILSRLVGEGILLPLNEHFDKAPNLYERKKEAWPALTYTDGNIYVFSASTSSMMTSYTLAYRKDWLDKLGLGIPTTIDEYIAVAEAVTKNDPDGDGVDNTYAMSGTGGFDHIFAAYGVLRESWMVDTDGKLINGSVHPNAREALRTLRKLYDMGTIDPEYLTDSGTRTKEKYINGVYGASMMQIQIFDKNNLNDYYKPFHDNFPDGQWVTGTMLKGPGYREDIGFHKSSQRGWLWTGVSAKTQELDAVMRVLDWLSTEEGIMLTNYGEENVHYTIKDNVVTSLVNAEGQKKYGITDCVIAFEYLFLDTSKEFQEAKTFANKFGTIDAADGIIVPEIEKYWTDLYEYQKTIYNQIIVGEVPVDSGFDTLLAEWKKRGGEELTAALNNAYQQLNK